MEYVSGFIFVIIILFRKEIIAGVAYVLTTYWMICLGLLALIVLAIIAIFRRMKREKEEIERIKGGKWADAYPYQGELAPVKNKMGLWGFVDRDGEVVYEPEFKGLQFFGGEDNLWECWKEWNGYTSTMFIRTNGERTKWMNDGVYRSPLYYAGEIRPDDDDESYTNEEEPEDEEGRVSTEDALWALYTLKELRDIEKSRRYDDDE